MCHSSRAFQDQVLEDLGKLKISAVKRHQCGTNKEKDDLNLCKNPHCF